MTLRLVSDRFVAQAIGSLASTAYAHPASSGVGVSTKQAKRQTGMRGTGSRPGRHFHLSSVRTANAPFMRYTKPTDAKKAYDARTNEAARPEWWLT